MAPKSVIMLDGSENLIFNTSRVANASIDTKRTVVQNKFMWKWWNDKNFPNVPVKFNSTPIEQLTLTHDESDYLFYTRNISVDTSGQKNLTIATKRANAFLAFVDESLQSNGGNHQHSDGDFTLQLPLNLKAGDHELTLLSVSLGIDNGVGPNS